MSAEQNEIDIYQSVILKKHGKGYLTYLRIYKNKKNNLLK